MEWDTPPGFCTFTVTMRSFESPYLLTRPFRLLMVVSYMLCSSFSAKAQCPQNIDFEKGNFSGWTCYVGSTEADGGQNFVYLNPVAAPVSDRHTLLNAYPGDGLDEYGGFPKNCPNGSGHSVKLGNDSGTAEAEGLSFDFTIPLTANKFRLTYNYAVVIQDPGHRDEEQPRMVIEVLNLTDQEVLNCSSFDFIADNSLPGFQVSPVPGTGNSRVLYRNWSSNTINLDGLEGKTIRFFVKTADCTYNAHFGYAYFDIVAQCSNNLSGSIYCSSDTAVDILAPAGYQQYTWLDESLIRILGTDSALHISPPPLPGTVIAVELTPFPGYGCVDTLLQIIDTIASNADAGADAISCNGLPVRIGTPSAPGLQYTWSPTTGLSNPQTPEPQAAPNATTLYHLTVSSQEGGCETQDSVLVRVRQIDEATAIIGRTHFCLGNPDGAVLRVYAADSIQWFKNQVLIPGVSAPVYSVSGTGNYYAVLYDTACTDPVKTQVVFIRVDTARPGIRYADVQVAQRFPIRLEARDFADSVRWLPANFLSDPSSETPLFRSDVGQNYLIQLYTLPGCKTTDTLRVFTYKKIAIYVPTAFTPNGDGRNDFLRPLLLGFQKVNAFRVYNRWGQKVFESNTDYPGWDGRLQKQSQGPQTFTWSIEAVDIDGKIHQQTGTTVLLP
jgi:gliding motility-associated-like protein